MRTPLIVSGSVGLTSGFQCGGALGAWGAEHTARHHITCRTSSTSRTSSMCPTNSMANAQPSVAPRSPLRRQTLSCLALGLTGHLHITSLAVHC